MCDLSILSSDFMSSRTMHCRMASCGSSRPQSRRSQPERSAEQPTPGEDVEIYTDSCQVFPEKDRIKIGQGTMATESDFEPIVCFNTESSTVKDLEASFGSRYRTMP